MLVKAKKIFGDGLVSMRPGDKAELKDEHAKRLILLDVVEEVLSHKKMKFKKVDVILPEDKEK